MVKFFDHQSAIISQDPKRTGLWLGTGGGKSRIALALARGKTLVIVPKTLKEARTWENECDKMRAGGINVKITSMIIPPSKLDTLTDGHAYPTVMSKEEFRRDYLNSEKMGFFNTIIVDEAETCLGVTPTTRQRKKVIIPKASQLFEALQYLNLVPHDRLYLCTATITRSPMTVWAAGTLLGKKWDWFKWRETFYVKLPMPGRDVWTPKKDDATKDRLAKAVRNIGFVGRLEDWFDVPEQTYKDDYVALTPAQEAHIKRIKLEYPDPIVALGKRLQVENGTLAGNEFEDAYNFPNKKIDRILHYAEEFPRMIVWAKYTEQINHIYNELKKKGYNVETLTGATKDRATLFTRLKTSPEAILIAQAQICAGWEWKECPVMIFASRTYSISDYEQALGRIQRTDNIKKNLYINLIVKGGVDEAVHKTLSDKKDFSERVYLNI